MPVGYGGVKAIEDFRIGLNPSVINVLVTSLFAATQPVTGFVYVVPAGRRCVIERIDLIVRVDGTIPAGGEIFINQSFQPAVGGAQTIRIMDLMEGEGPGVVSLLGLPFGQMFAVDALVVSLTAISAASGFWRSQLHGVEYDV